MCGLKRSWPTHSHSVLRANGCLVHHPLMAVVERASLPFFVASNTSNLALIVEALAPSATPNRFQNRREAH